MNRSVNGSCLAIAKRLGLFFLLISVAGIFPSCSKGSEEKGKVSIEASGPASSEVKPLSPVVYELLMNELMRSTEKWSSLDQDLKMKSVEGFITLVAQREKAKIGKPVDYYVSRIDEMVSNNPGAQNIPSLIKIVAIMDYDFDSGVDKDKLAQEVLGAKLYMANKARLAQAASAEKK